MRRLDLAGWMMLVLAMGCTDRLPTAVGDREGNQAFDSRPSALIGTWEARTLTDVGIEVSETRVRWQFNPDGSCDFVRRTVAGNGTEQIEERACTYVDRGSTVAVTYTDDGTTDFLDYTVSSDPAPQLVLDSVTYDRTDL